MNTVTLCVVAVVLILIGAFLPIFFYIQNLKRENRTLRKACKDVELRHYIISAGLKEIISGSGLAKYFYKIFASEYYYDEYDRAIFPNVIVNDTLKTQFIFRINKGKEELHENINLHIRRLIYCYFMDNYWCFMVC